MGLYLRMALYAGFAILAGQGLIIYDHEAGSVTFYVEDAHTLIMGVVGFLGTFGSSRVAKAKGGNT